MPQSRHPLQRVILIFSGLAFLGGTVFASLSLLGEQPGTQHGGGGYPAAAGGGDPEAGEVQDQLTAIEEGYAAVLEREPENLTALQGLVQARVEMGKLEEALEPLKTLQSIDPENPQVLQAIAAISIQLQQFPEAVESLEQLTELQPDNAELQTQLEALKTFVETGELPELPTESEHSASPDATDAAPSEASSSESQSPTPSR
ncbi:MAG: tetratricopeptide repeat protein [Spirulina sp. SIO3F2]|nr:tetratricopeptide repeat protein [Spirulina sp. SIO3F2]